MFFGGKDPVHRVMDRLVKKLKKLEIPHAVVGGMAVLAHRYRRTTNDVDVLLTREGFERFCKKFVPKDYDRIDGRPRRFRDRKYEVSFDVLISGMFPGSGQPGPISYPDPADVCQLIDDVSVIDLPTLIQLKLAARRYQDFADVVNLIRANELDESFQAKLHPSLHRDYIECVDECRREEEYERRQDEQMSEEG
ncbi:MAG: hypothetical protein AB7K24_17005 [Gemmataceae bacterium]